MEDNYFAESNKFLGLKGIIGRRNFIINVLFVELFESLIWTTPFFYLFMLNPKVMGEFSIATAKSGIMPLWVTLWIAVIGVLSSGLLFPSIVRRVRDIIGEVDDNRVYLISSVLTVIIFMGYTPVGMGFFGKWISFFVILMLVFTKGKITSKKPANKLIKFNWGAFFGTWIWGVLNKAPTTLWMLPLCLTFGWFPFMLICGIKGNEWAMNEKYESLDEFHKAQSNQATVWAILAPFLAVGGFFGISIISGLLFYKYSHAHPQFINKLESMSKEYQQVAVESNFTKIELEEDEYKFYIEPQVWSKLTTKYQKQMLDMAGRYAATTKNDANELAENKKYPLPIATLNKTKIYSSFNNEVLAEFHVDAEQYSKELGQAKSLKEILNITGKGYNFNNHPAMP